MDNGSIDSSLVYNSILRLFEKKGISVSELDDASARYEMEVHKKYANWQRRAEPTWKRRRI